MSVSLRFRNLSSIFKLLPARHIHRVISLETRRASFREEIFQGLSTVQPYRVFTSLSGSRKVGQRSSPTPQSRVHITLREAFQVSSIVQSYRVLSILGRQSGKAVQGTPTSSSYDHITLKRVVQDLNTLQPFRVFTNMNRSTLESILSRHTFEQHSVEYDGYLFNHICHGIISLYRLGADEARIQRFIEWYTPRLEDVETRKRYEKEHGEKTTSTELDEKKLAADNCSMNRNSRPASIAELRGQGSSFYFILEVFGKQLTEAFGGSTRAMLQKCYPDLFRGIAGSAFHGVIHLGYGCAAKNTRLITEGVAYLHYCYLPLITSQSALDKHPLDSLGNGPNTVQEVVEQIRNDHELRTYLTVQSNDPVLVARESNRFERPLRVLLIQRGDTLLEYVHRIQFPSNLNRSKSSVVTQEFVDRLFKWAIDVALIVYSRSERRNDFFLLHGITSAFSLREINSFISSAEQPGESAMQANTNPFTTQAASEAYLTDMAFEAVRTYLCTLLAAYLVQGAPALIQDPALDSLKCSWVELRDKALGGDYDEHIYKLLQICRELDAETEDPVASEIYKSAVNIALEYEFTFHPDDG